MGGSGRWRDVGATFVLGLAIVATTFGSGCSIIFVNPSHPSGREGERRDWTVSYAAPVMDTLIGGYEAVRTGLAINSSNAAYRGATLSRPEDIGFGVVFTTLFVASAIYGYTVISANHEAIEKEDQAQQRAVRRAIRAAVKAADDPTDDADPDAAAAAQAKAFGEAAHAAPPAAARPSQPKRATD